MANFPSDAPESELETAGPVAAAVDALLAAPVRGKDGRFVSGNPSAVKTTVHSDRLAGLLAGARRDIAAQVLADRGGDGGASATVQRLAGAFAEVTLLRESVFEQMERLGGAVSAKGKARALMAAYVTLLDREVRVALALGLERRVKPTHASPREWLESLQPDEPDDDTPAAEAGAAEDEHDL